MGDGLPSHELRQRLLASMKQETEEEGFTVILGDEELLLSRSTSEEEGMYEVTAVDEERMKEEINEEKEYDYESIKDNPYLLQLAVDRLTLETQHKPQALPPLNKQTYLKPLRKLEYEQKKAEEQLKKVTTEIQRIRQKLLDVDSRYYHMEKKRKQLNQIRHERVALKDKMVYRIQTLEKSDERVNEVAYSGLALEMDQKISQLIQSQANIMKRMSRAIEGNVIKEPVRVEERMMSGIVIMGVMRVSILYPFRPNPLSVEGDVPLNNGDECYKVIGKRDRLPSQYESPLLSLKSIRVSRFIDIYPIPLHDIRWTNAIHPFDEYCMDDFVSGCKDSHCPYLHMKDMALSPTESKLDIASYAPQLGIEENVEGIVMESILEGQNPYRKVVECLRKRASMDQCPYADLILERRVMKLKVKRLRPLPYGKKKDSYREQKALKPLKGRHQELNSAEGIEAILGMCLQGEKGNLATEEAPGYHTKEGEYGLKGEMQNVGMSQSLLDEDVFRIVISNYPRDELVWITFCLSAFLPARALVDMRHFDAPFWRMLKGLPREAMVRSLKRLASAIESIPFSVLAWKMYCCILFAYGSEQMVHGLVMDRYNAALVRYPQHAIFWILTCRMSRTLLNRIELTLRGLDALLSYDEASPVIYCELICMLVESCVDSRAYSCALYILKCILFGAYFPGFEELVDVPPPHDFIQQEAWCALRARLFLQFSSHQIFGLLKIFQQLWMKLRFPHYATCHASVIDGVHVWKERSEMLLSQGKLAPLIKFYIQLISFWSGNEQLKSMVAMELYHLLDACLPVEKDKVMETLSPTLDLSKWLPGERLGMVERKYLYLQCYLEGKEVESLVEDKVGLAIRNGHAVRCEKTKEMFDFRHAVVWILQAWKVWREEHCRKAVWGILARSLQKVGEMTERAEIGKMMILFCENYQTIPTEVADMITALGAGIESVEEEGIPVEVKGYLDHQHWFLKGDRVVALYSLLFTCMAHYSPSYMYSFLLKHRWHHHACLCLFETLGNLFYGEGRISECIQCYEILSNGYRFHVPYWVKRIGLYRKVEKHNLAQDAIEMAQKNIPLYAWQEESYSLDIDHFRVHQSI